MWTWPKKKRRCKMMKVKMRTREASEEEGDEDGRTDEVEAREE